MRSRPKSHYSTFLPASVKQSLKAAAENQQTGGTNGAVILILESLGLPGDDPKALGRAIATEVWVRGSRLVPWLKNREAEEWLRTPIAVDGDIKLALEEAGRISGVQRMALLGFLLIGMEGEYEERIASARRWRVARGIFPETSRGRYRPAA